MSMLANDSLYELQKEADKCRRSPYYFFTTYFRVNKGGNDVKFSTKMSEEQFNKEFFDFELEALRKIPPVNP